MANSSLSDIKVTRTEGVWSSFDFKADGNIFYPSIDEALEEVEIITTNNQGVTTDIVVTLIENDDRRIITANSSSGDKNTFNIALDKEFESDVEIAVTEVTNDEHAYKIVIIRSGAFDIVRSFFESHLSQGALLDVIGADIPVIYENTPQLQYGDAREAQENKTPWFRCCVLRGSGQAVSSGEIVIRRYTGMCILNMFLEQFQGTRTGWGWVENITDHILDKAYGKETRVTHLLVRTPSPTIIGQSEGWYQINLSIPFQFDYHHRLRGT